MHFGAAIWPFQWHPPYEDAIRRVARLGFRSVELPPSPKTQFHSSIVSAPFGSVLPSVNVQSIPVQLIEPITAVGAALGAVTVTTCCSSSSPPRLSRTRSLTS